MSALAFQMQESIKSIGDFLLKSLHYGVFPLKLLKISLTGIGNHQNIRIASMVSNQWPTTTVNSAVLACFQWSVCVFSILH